MLVVGSMWFVACAAEDKDDTGGTQTVGDESSGAGSESSSSAVETSTGDEAMICADARADAVAFLGANQACEVDEDCTGVSTFCLDGSTCGTSPIAVGFDQAAWMAISDALNTCTDCGADPCGACAACTDGICTLSVSCE